MATVLAASNAYAQDRDLLKVQVEGRAEGRDNAAYQRAIEDARRDAVEQLLQTTLSAEEYPSAQPLIDNAANYVGDIHVTDRTQRADETHVTADAWLDDITLRRDLAILFVPKLSDAIRVLVLVAESLDGTPARVRAEGVAQVQLMEYLSEQGLRVAAPHDVIPHYDPAELAELMEASPDTLAELARQNLADAIVGGVVRVNVEPAPGVNMLRNEAVLSLRVVSTEDGKMHGAIANTSAVFSGEVETGARQAVEDAVHKVQDRVFVSTTMAALRAVPQGGTVVTVNGLSESQFEALCAWLRDQFGQESVTPLHFAPTRARLRVDYEGPMGVFMDTLIEHRYPTFELETRQAVGRMAEVEAVGRGDGGRNENGPEP